jgi:hypothetical protein
MKSSFVGEYNTDMNHFSRRLVKKGMQLILWHSNSEPYLSGDLFADKADVNVFPPAMRELQPSRKKISEAKVIFCPSEYLERFLDEYGKIVTARVLILGNGDRDFHHLDFNFPGSIRKLFVQNLMFESPRAQVLPIGLENRRLAANGLMHNFSLETWMQEKSKLLLVGPFGDTHVDRKGLDSFNSSVHTTKLISRISPTQYSIQLRSSKFVACPRGNGMDTHRFWECLYVGAKPVVRISDWSTMITRLGLPIIEIEEWNQPDIELKLLGYENAPLNPRAIPSLWWPYWRSEISKFL